MLIILHREEKFWEKSENVLFYKCYFQVLKIEKLVNSPPSPHLQGSFGVIILDHWAFKSCNSKIKLNQIHTFKKIIVKGGKGDFPS